MSWKKTEPMTEKLKFIAAAQDGAYSITELCKHFGISRKRTEGADIDQLQRWLQNNLSVTIVVPPPLRDPQKTRGLKM